MTSSTPVQRTRSVVTGRTLRSFVDDPSTGTVSLVGDHDGLSLITGEIAESSVVPDTVYVETEHGTVYIGLDHEQEVESTCPSYLPELSPDEPSQNGLLVSWEIDDTEGPGRTPLQAA